MRSGGRSPPPLTRPLTRPRTLSGFSLNPAGGPRTLPFATMLDTTTIDALRRRSFDLRIDNLTAIATAGNGHPGGTLSVMDILQTLFFAEMRHRPNEPHWPERDRLRLSKGHAVRGRYPGLAR